MAASLMAAQSRPSAEAGFSLVESLVAVTVLAFGLLAIAAAFTQGLRMVTGSELDIIAREKAAEAIESVFGARDTRAITWDEIRNAQGESGDDGGVFLDGPRPLTRPGADGLVNTEDDDGDDLDTILKPGPDGELVPQPLTQFTREIEIRDVNPTLRQLRVVIRYAVGGQPREYAILAYISSYA